MNKSVNTLGLLFIVLVVLKLTGLGQLSWLMVFCPLWGPPALVLGAIAAFILLMLAILLVCMCLGKGTKGVKRFMATVKRSIGNLFCRIFRRKGTSRMDR